MKRARNGTAQVSPAPTNADPTDGPKDASGWGVALAFSILPTFLLVMAVSFPESFTPEYQVRFHLVKGPVSDPVFPLAEDQAAVLPGDVAGTLRDARQKGNATLTYRENDLRVLLAGIHHRPQVAHHLLRFQGSTYEYQLFRIDYEQDFSEQRHTVYVPVAGVEG